MVVIQVFTEALVLLGKNEVSWQHTCGMPLPFLFVIYLKNFLVTRVFTMPRFSTSALTPCAQKYPPTIPAYLNMKRSALTGDVAKSCFCKQTRCTSQSRLSKTSAVVRARGRHIGVLAPDFRGEVLRCYKLLYGVEYFYACTVQ